MRQSVGVAVVYLDRCVQEAASWLHQSLVPAGTHSVSQMQDKVFHDSQRDSILLESVSVLVAEVGAVLSDVDAAGAW